MRAGEFDLIERIRRRVVERADVALGIGDDAALLDVPPGRQLAVATDTLNAGVHFPHDTAPADIGWKALAVNLSDLAAMGATPAWCTLSLSMPASDPAWLDAFVDGFGELASLHGVALVGGDTTRGPLSIGVTVHGLVEPGRALRRDAARPGDDVWVSGTLGDAAGGLRLLAAADAARASRAPADARPAPQDRSAQPASHEPSRASLQVLRARLDRPTPRVALGVRLQGLAHACIDVSDGLLADLGHVAAASGVAFDVGIDALPRSDALAACFDAQAIRPLQASGGDDYELAFTAPVASRAAIDALAAALGLRLTRIGAARAGQGVHARDADGRAWHAARAGFDHFDGAASA